MTLTRRAKWALVAGVFGLVLAGLGVYFTVVGLERAERLSSVLGLFVGLLGLAIAAYGTYAARNPPAPAPAPQPAPAPPGQGGAGGVQGNTFHGPAVIQSGEHNRQENTFRP